MDEKEKNKLYHTLGKMDSLGLRNELRADNIEEEIKELKQDIKDLHSLIGKKINGDM